MATLARPLTAVDRKSSIETRAWQLRSTATEENKSGRSRSESAV